MEAQLARDTTKATRHALAWLNTHQSELEAEGLSRLAGYVRFHASSGHVRRAENAAIAYLQANRVGTQFAAVTPEVAPGWDADEVSAYVGRVLAAADKWGLDDPRFIRKFEATITRMIMARARATVKHNAKAAGLRYARVPEAGACWFCLMLASKGPAYTDKATAVRSRDGSKYHPHCRCTLAEVVKGKDGVEKLPPRVRACMDFAKHHRGASLEDWRELVASGEFTKATGIRSTTRDLEVLRQLKLSVRKAVKAEIKNDKADRWWESSTAPYAPQEWRDRCSGQLSESQLIQVRRWSDYEYEDFQKFAFTGKAYGIAQQDVDILDSALEAFPPDEEIIVHRLARAGDFGFKDIADIQASKRNIQTKGYLASSLQTGGVAASGDDDRFVAILRVRPGAPALDISKVSYYPDEEEVLIRRGVNARIDHIEGHGSDMRAYITVWA